MVRPEPPDPQPPNERKNSLCVPVAAGVHKRLIYADETGHPATGRIIGGDNQGDVTDNLWRQCPPTLTHGVLTVDLSPCDAIVGYETTLELEAALQVDFNQSTHVGFSVLNS